MSNNPELSAEVSKDLPASSSSSAASCSAVVDDQDYENILRRFNELRSQLSIIQMRNIIRQLKQEFCQPNVPNGLTVDALSSLIACAYQQEQKWRHRAANWPLILSEHETGQSLLSLSKAAHISPRLVAQKLITEQMSETASMDQVKLALADSNQMDDGRLAFEAMLASYCDPVYGSHAAHVAANAGSRFEQKVAKGLRNLPAFFASEKDMRPSYDVTPDFKLTVPLVLTRQSKPSETNQNRKASEGKRDQLPSDKHENKAIDSKRNEWNEAQLLVHDCDRPNSIASCNSKETKIDLINWIECKALFANADVHEEHTRNQLDAYGNRFGKGLVLYQHGCVKSLLGSNPHFVVWPGEPRFSNDKLD